jgi:predicted ATPase
MPAPYLRLVRLDQSLVRDVAVYPYCLPFLRGGFEIEFEKPITIIIGENGTGKSTVLEGIAALAGYDGNRPLSSYAGILRRSFNIHRLCSGGLNLAAG